MKTLLFTIAFYLLPLFAIACSCIGPQTFCETIDLEFNEDIIIVGGKKIRQKDHIMEVEIFSVYQGEESRSKISVIGDRGADCLVYTSVFDIGEEVILSLRQNEDASVEGDYYLSICGVHYIRCDTRLNPFTGEPEEVSDCLAEEICSCSTSNPSFYPNPSDGKVFTNINLTGDSVKDFIYVYSISGQRVRQLKIAEQNYSEGTLELDLYGLAAGVYFVQYGFQQDCKDIANSRIVISS